MMNSNNQVICFGEVLWDLLPSGKVLGGAPANVAYRLSSLGIKPTLLSSIGKDSLGEELEQELQAKGIDTKYLQRHSTAPTGTVEVSLNDAGNPRYRIVPNVAYDFIEYSESLQNLANQGSLVVFGTLAQRGKETKSTIEQFLNDATAATKILDINLRKDCFTLDTIKSSLEAATIVKLNESEQKYLTETLALPCSTEPGSFSRSLFERFDLSVILITHGEKGVYAFSSEGENIHVAARQVQVVDSIGAGDAFTAGFTFGFLNNLPLKQCCELGNSLGGATATVQGGMGELTQEFIQELLSKPEDGGLLINA